MSIPIIFAFIILFLFFVAILSASIILMASIRKNEDSSNEKVETYLMF